MVNDPAFLDDIYVKYNKYFTKHPSLRLKAPPAIELGLLAIQTDHEEYAHRRKSVSSAFFKSKVESMSKVIKAVTLDNIKKLTDGHKVGDSKVIDLQLFIR